MTSVILSIAVMSCATTASPCLDNQHCSDCDVTTGYCLTECDTGYFDLKCFSECDGHCKGNMCNQSADGSGRCIQGCEPGYQGALCNIQCDSPGDSCTACPGGCDGGYCQLGSSCVSGCVDSYYGTGCYNTCSTNCRRNPIALEDQRLVIVQSDCHRASGDCIFGCNNGWYGPQCSSRYDRTATINVMHMTVGVATMAVLVIILGVCCRFCKCRCCRRGNRAETGWENSENMAEDSEWSLETDQCRSKMDQEPHSSEGAECAMYDVVYSSPEEGLDSDRCDLPGWYSTIEEGLVSDRRDVAYSSPVYTGGTVVRYMSPVLDPDRR